MSRRLLPIVCLWLLLCWHAQAAVEQLATFPTPAPVNVFLVAKTGTLGAGLCRDGRLRVWALPEGRLLRTVEPGITNIEVTAISHDGRFVFTGTHGGEAVVWDTGTGLAAFQTQLLPYPAAAEFSRDNRYLATAPSGGRARIFDLAGRTNRFELESVAGGTLAFAFSPDDRLLATADGDTQIRIYDSRTGKLLARNCDFLMEPFAVDFCANGRQVVAGGADKLVVFLDASSGKAAKRLRKLPDPVFYLGVSSDGKMLATVLIKPASTSQPVSMWVWEIGSGRKRMEWIPSSPLVGGAWVRDGHLLAATATPEKVHIWRLY